MESLFLVESVKGNQVKIRDHGGSELTILIQEPWIPFTKFLTEHMEIYAKLNKQNAIDKSGYIILEPSFLVAVTSITDSIICPRRTYVKNLGAADTPDIAQLKRITEGNLLHDIFAMRISNSNLKLEEIIDIIIKRSRSDLVSLALDEENLENYLKENAPVFNRFNKLNGQGEVDCQNWNYGVVGKFDGLVRTNILELKTSRIPDGNPWPDHDNQIHIYQSMMSSRAEHKGNVVYVRNGKMSFKSPSEKEDVEWMVSRNWAYLAQTGKFIPLILRGNEAKACERCFVKEGCRTLCAGLGTQRDCERCIHFGTCDKKRWDQSTLMYFVRLVSALFHEEYQESKSQKMLSRAGITGDKTIDALIQRGYAIRVDTKLNEIFVDGRYETAFTHSTQMNRFRRGDFVQVYDQQNKDDVATLYLTAIIKSIDSTSLLLQTNNPVPSDIVIISSGGSRSLRTGRRATYSSVTSNSDLIRSLLNPQKNDFNDFIPSFNLANPFKNYNSVQLEAIKGALSTPDLFLIQGPAGTGKTSVIVEIVHQLFQNGKMILVSAFTNMAIDNVGMKLKEHNLPFIRIGNPNSINQEIFEFSITKRQDEYISAIENSLPLILLSTTSSIARAEYAELILDYVIIDEAAQMTEPESLKALLHGNKIVLVGDHKQLQPIVKSSEAISKNLQVSLFERLVDHIPNRFQLLTHQYRMNDEILTFPNEYFYDGKLQAANDEIASHHFQASKGIITNDPFQMIVLHDKSISRDLQINTYEALTIVQIARILLEEIKDLHPNQIGIITPFRAQVAKLRDLLPGFTIDTVDRYQGSEKDIIIFSTITTASIPILSDPRRFNVALTRARKKLIVLVSNPIEKGQSLVNLLFSSTMNRGLLTEIESTELTSISSSKNTDFNLDFIAKRTGLNRGSSIGKIIALPTSLGSFVGIYFDTILLMEVELEDAVSCAICYSDTKIGVECIGCGYWFHKDQLFTWVEKSGKCPVCKHVLKIQTF